MKTLKMTIEFWREGNLYLARSPELDMIAQGNSLKEAKRNLLEVIEIQFEEMKELGTLDEFLRFVRSTEYERRLASCSFGGYGLWQASGSNI